MGRKKKASKKDILEEEDGEEPKSSFLHGDAKRSVAAVFLFVFALLFVLGFFGSAGPLGDALDKGVGMALGWGKWTLPPVLAVSGIFLLRRRRLSFGEALKLAGLAAAFLSLLGFSHLYLDGDLSAAAGRGEGGGYAGFALAYLLLQTTGVVAGSLILAALLLTGLIVVFNWSLIHFFEGARARMARRKEAEAGAEDEGPEEGIVEEEADQEESALAREAFGEDSEPAPKKAEVVSDELEKQNIRSIEFVGEEEAGEEAEEDAETEVEDDGDEEAEEAPVRKAVAKKRRKKRAPHWDLPPTDILESSTGKAKGGNTEEMAAVIQKTLKNFGIEVEPGEVQTGPTVTQYSFRPAVGVKLSRITGLSNDLALALAAHPIRIEAPIPGKSLVGIEVPNRSTAMVRLKDILKSRDFSRKDSALSLVLGQDVSGQYIISDLRRMPHVLVAGATNSGKSVCVNSMLLSLLYQNSPEDLKLILVDPKRVELSLYGGIPHLLTDVIVENKKVVNALKWAVSEMDRRYKLLQETGSRDLVSYTEKLHRGEVRTVTDSETGETAEEDMEKLPYIVIVIDEMADLMMAHGKEVEGLVVRLAQMARAVGIHLVLATQRPSVEVLTGLIKANVTTRIAFQVATQIDSRTILDQGGAEKLLGRGDMLFLAAGAPQPKRLQGVFISEAEVKKVVDFWRKQKLEVGNEEGIGDNLSGGEENPSGGPGLDLDGTSESGAQEDDLYLEAKQIVVQLRKASASLLQRRLRVGYARAARLLDLLENDGIIGPADGAKPREVFVGAGGPSAGSEEEDDPVSEQEKRDKWQI
jgi:S-DNA-T family DNA segregation ATPase FtsK/SpoIIIE